MTDIDHARPGTDAPWPPPAPEDRLTEQVGEDEQPQGRLGLFILLALTAALGIFWGWSVVVVVLAIAVMVFMHELGHYLTAKSAGMKVTEFFLGFGPRVWSFRRGETEYGIKAFPLGAYVKIIGMHNLEEVDPADEGRTYRSKPYWRRLSVATAGSAMHFIMAFFLAMALLVGWGVQADTWTVRETPPAQDGGHRRLPPASGCSPVTGSSPWTASRQRTSP
jgi:membrane-associated protease RseP (regulator of RpoE activity)